jgi:hypothetical protein
MQPFMAHLRFPRDVRRREVLTITTNLTLLREAGCELCRRKRGRRAALRYIRDALQAWFYWRLAIDAQQRGWYISSHSLANDLLDLLLEVESLDLDGIAAMLNRPQRETMALRRAFQRGAAIRALRR